MNHMLPGRPVALPLAAWTPAVLPLAARAARPDVVDRHNNWGLRHDASQPAEAALRRTGLSLQQRQARVRQVQRLAGNRAAQRVVQRDLLGDAWQTVSGAGQAVADAMRLTASVAANPAQLPLVLSAVAWQHIPDALKGPIIDRILQACLMAARHTDFPAPPGPPVGAVLKHVAIGFLERALSYPTGMKVRIADRMAGIVVNPSPEFSLGFLVGLLHGLWDGLTGPFVLLWDLLKIAAEIQAAQLRLIARLVDRDARTRMGRDIDAALDRLRPRVQAALAELGAGRANPAAILGLFGRLVDGVVQQVEALGATLSDAMLRFLNRPDRQLGEGLGWLGGTLTFEALLLVLTEGGYTVLKESLSGLRVVVRLIQAGERAWEALTPVRAALAGFRSFAASNRALAPLLQALEEVFSLFVRFLRFSYGLGGPAATAGRAGEHGAAAAERGAAREIRVADTAMRESHEITLLADGRLIRCSDRCMALAQSIAERARLLERAGMPGEARRLSGEATELAQQASALGGNRGLDETRRAAQESELLRKAASLERQTAAAELEAFTREFRRPVGRCRVVFESAAGDPRMRQFEAELRELETETTRNFELLLDPDPEMRELARAEGRALNERATELEGRLRAQQPPAAVAASAAFDVRAFEERIAHLPPNERVAAVREQARAVAERRNLQRQAQFSERNGRDVYVDPATGELFAVDTQHGRFEHCDPRGTHLGELNFDFRGTKNADPSGGHDLFVR
jgi:hypothetical protein